MQRLFSTFPNGWPGVGLLLLRGCLAATLLYFGAVGLSERSPQTIGFAQNLIAGVAGIFLLIGLWTPLMGTVVALDEVWTAFSFYALAHGNMWFHILMAILAASVAMLGPGAWSIDARLFGRKRFDIDRAPKK